jgi:hypothetical protein
VARPSARYEPRRPAEDVLSQIVQAYLETFLAQAASLRDGNGLPPFVEGEFRAFLRCGSLAGGFARFRCTACGLDRLVAFSCKGRGFCPSCGGRRMAERAAHLVDHVFPDVPVRQWVLSLPYRLRYRLAWDHDLCRAVVAVYMRAVLGWPRPRCRAASHWGVSGGRAFVVWASRPTRSGRARSAAATRDRTVSICMLASSCPLGSASGSSGCVGTRCGHPWREIDSV